MKLKPSAGFMIPLLFVSIILTNCKMENNKGSNEETYTLGIWTVKPDMEKEFIREWTSFANWTGEKFPGPGKAYLLQDKSNSLRFISFGPWHDEETIHKWRESPEFKDFVIKVEQLCEDFQPNTLKVASTTN